MTLQEGDQVHLAVDDDGSGSCARVLAARRDTQDEPAETQEAAR